MRWEDERYVRVYTRDTPEWACLSWEAQALFLLLLRKVDRAGMLPTGRVGIRGVAGLVRMPLNVVEVAMQELLDDGCVVAIEGGYAVPNFMAAQEARASDAARKREQRERARSLAVTRCPAVSNPRDNGHTESHGVTIRDHVSQNVTDCPEAVTRSHTESHGVTPSLAQPSLAQPSVCSGSSSQTETRARPSATAPQRAHSGSIDEEAQGAASGEPDDPMPPGNSKSAVTPRKLASSDASQVEDPLTAGIRAELEAHASTQSVARSDLAEVLTGRAMAAGKRLDWVRTAIAEAAADLEPGTPATRVRKVVRSYCDRAEAPEARASPASPGRMAGPPVQRGRDLEGERLAREQYEREVAARRAAIEAMPEHERPVF